MASLNVKALAILQKTPEDRSLKEVEQIVPWLKKKTNIVQGLETDLLKQILKNCEYMRVQKDDVIIEQGDQGDTLYIILTGTVSVYVDSSKTGGEETVPKREATPKPIRQGASQSNTRQGTRAESSHQGATDTTAAEKSVISPDNKQTAEEKQPSRLATQVSRSKSKTKTDIKETSSVTKNRDRSSSDLNIHKVAKSKAKYGKMVVKFEEGKCFGEIALISDENIRNATIISDGLTELMLIRKELYDSTLKDYQEREFVERRDFVRKHPLFRGWNKRIQRLLEMSLVKEIYTFGAQMIRQGEPWNGLTFIQKGRARVLVEPARHNQQYSELFPFATKNDIYEIEFNRPQRPPPEHPEEILRWEHIEIRRTEGYAAAERRRFNREIPMCIVEEGEILGDIECTCNLSTHAVSAVCMAPTEVFVLTAKNIDRLITKKIPSTLNTLRMEVETKLRNRLSSKQGSEVFLYRHLLFKLTEQLQPIVRKPIDVSTTRLSLRNMPEKEVLFQHLMETFMDSKAEAVIPYTEGSVYLREKMREKARLRDAVKQNQGERWAHREKKRVVRRPPSAKPRSIKHLKIALKKQEQGDAATEREYLAGEYRNVEQQVMKDFYLTALSGLSGTGSDREGLHVICDRLNRGGKSLRPPKSHIRTAQSMPDIGQTLDTNRSVSNDAEKLSRLSTREPTFVTELHERETVALETPTAAAELRDEQGASQVNDEEHSGFSSPLAQDSQVNDQEKSLKSSPLPPIHIATKPTLNVNLDTPKTPPLNATSELIVAKEAVHMTSRSVESGNDVSSEHEQWITDAHAHKLQHLQDALKNKVELSTEDPHYRDWETSDTSLQYLEERVRNFKIHRDPTFVRLPSLPRYQAGDDKQQPRPGGRVIMHRRRCNAATSTKFVVNHDHVHHKVVPRVHDYDKLKHHKMLTHFALDDIREKWLQEHGKK